MYRYSLTLLISLLMLGQLQAETLTFAGIEGSANSDISERVLREAYQTLGITIVVERYPGKRALALSNNGNVDGELFRIAGIENSYPNLIKIPTPINMLEGITVSLQVLPDIDDWATLSDYVVGTQRGIKFVEKGLEDVPNLRNLVVNRNEQLLDALLAKRVDVAVLARLNAISLLATKPSVNAYIGHKPLVVHPLHHYLHKSHQDKVPKLDEALRLMKKEDRILAIREDYISELKSALFAKKQIN